VNNCHCHYTINTVKYQSIGIQLGTSDYYICDTQHSLLFKHCTLQQKAHQILKLPVVCDGRTVGTMVDLVDGCHGLYVHVCVGE
jgi:hypothetical protein